MFVLYLCTCIVMYMHCHVHVGDIFNCYLVSLFITILLQLKHFALSGELQRSNIRAICWKVKAFFIMYCIIYNHECSMSVFGPYFLLVLKYTVDVYHILSLQQLTSHFCIKVVLK